MAAIDMNMSERIFWPGGKEKPRIKYLWAIQRVRGAEGGTLGRAVFGEPARGDGTKDTDFLVKPHGVHLDAIGRLMITDSGTGAVNVIDLSDMKSFSITETEDVRVFSPIAVASAADGRIYVSDSALGRVGMFRADGDFTRFIDGIFKRPTGLAVDRARGILYVADTWDHIIYMYDLEGRKLGSMGGRGKNEGEFNYPTHLAVGGDGTLYVSDTLNFRVQMFSPGAEFLGAFGIPGESYDAFDKIKGIAVDSHGHIYVTDSVQDMVKIFDREGRLLLFFGKKGRFYGDFAHPAGIYIDGRDRIFVADSLNRRVQVFQFLGEGPVAR
jgi:sugar lactone lactonase YvrE